MNRISEYACYELGIRPDSPAVLELSRDGAAILHVPGPDAEFGRYRIVPLPALLDLAAWEVLHLDPPPNKPARPYRVALESASPLKYSCECDWYTKSRQKGTWCKHTQALASLRQEMIRLLGGAQC